MSSILLKIEENVAYLTLNRPEKFNSFNQEMARSLQNIISECAENKEVRAVLLSGTGKAFCAGQDLGEAIDDNGIELPEIVEKHYNPIIKQIRNIEKPVICAVNGVAAGAGANIALACDIVIADENASFIQAFSKIGLIPDSAGTFFLPRLVGLQKATALMMLGDKVSAIEAKEMGMIYRCWPSEVFEEESKKLALKLAKMPTKGLGLTKRLLNESFSNNLSEQLQREKEVQTEAGQTFDYQEGVNAFLEKRKPQFKGE
jgi:2-(1,2-epoxy-1,2-dihydrophenyl)acetyl-CoA isomerase